jgi:hypothetical protein
MDNLENITTEVSSSSLDTKKENKKISLEEIINFFTDHNEINSQQLVAGRIYQKNKKLKFLETFFKLVEEEISKIETKNNKDLDNSFFNLNKKILSNNIYNIKEIINIYGIDENRLITFLLGTVIQSLYDKKD